MGRKGQIEDGGSGEEEQELRKIFIGRARIIIYNNIIYLYLRSLNVKDMGEGLRGDREGGKGKVVKGEWG